MRNRGAEASLREKGLVASAVRRVDVSAGSRGRASARQEKRCTAGPAASSFRCACAIDNNKLCLNYLGVSAANKRPPLQ
jgi:hypothetical protein